MAKIAAQDISPGLASLIDLPEMVNRALASSDLAELFNESGLTAQQILDEVTPKLPDFISVAADAGDAMVKSELELNTLNLERNNQIAALGEAPQRRQFFFHLGLAVLSVMGLIACFAFGWFTQPVIKGDPIPWKILSPLVLSLLFIVEVVMALFWWQRQTRYLARLPSVMPIDRIQAQQQELSALRSQFLQTIYDQGVRSEVNGILSKATTPSYAASLGEAKATSLSEVFVAGHEVETQARRDLNDLLQLPGGSIGLAGPRGSGKTTLMTLIARRPGPKGKACYVLCPAPVEYPGRDYLTTLFLLLCKWVIDDRSPELSVELPPNAVAAESRLPAWSAGVVEILPSAVRLAALAGIAFLILGLGLAYPFLLAANLAKPASPAPEAAPAAAKIPAPAPPPKHTPQQEVLLQSVQYIKLIGITPSKFVSLGAALFAAAFCANFVFRRLHLTRQAFLDRRWFSLSGRRRPSRPFELEFEPENEDPLAQEAQDLKESLRFQQSYSSGWSGSLKLPIGLEGSLNDARSLSKNQRSLPELVGEFQSFLRKVAAEYGRVTICIDELDKMESDDKAHLFLNEIKAIFGVPNVFYLVSVSENAISAFERRGLPFRDVFDSSFDSIVHVDYLNLYESKDLLKRRTTRLPEPFLALCHVLSGGLPRDLIRACRDMLDVAQEEKEKDLIPLARRLITHETRGKARGMSIAVSKLPADIDQTRFLSLLTELLTRSLDEASLLSAASALLVAADQLRDRVEKLPPATDGPIREQVLQMSALAELQTEFGLYLAYVATVLEVFIEIDQRSEWITAEGSLSMALGTSAPLPLLPNVFDQLAATRQSLAVSVSVGRQRLVAFRFPRGLNNTGIDLNPPAPPAPNPPPAIAP